MMSPATHNFQWTYFYLLSFHLSQQRFRVVVLTGQIYKEN